MAMQSEKIQVMIVDDDLAFLELTKIYLENIGRFNVVTTDSPKKLFDLLKSNRCEAIISDYEMPGENGIQLLKQIRADGSRVPFILFTGKGREEVAIEALNNGADFYLQKGGDPKSLFAELSHKVIAAVEQRQNEMALKESESKFRALVETSPDTIWEINDRGIFKYVSPTIFEMLGYRPGELVGTPIFNLLEKESADFAKADIMDHIRKKDRTHTLEVRGVHKNGNTRTIEIRSMSAIDDNGQFIGFRGIAHDITERKGFDAKLRHSQNLLNHIITNTRSAVAVHDRDLNYLFVSQKYLDEYKVKDRNIIGKQHYDVFPDLPQKWRDVHQRALKGEVLSAEDDPYYREDGSVDWTRWECRPWYTEEGSIGGIIVYTEVINDRKNVEDNLRESQALLAEAMDLANLVNWEYDVSSNMFTFNDRFFKLYGTTATEEGTYQITSEEYVRKFVYPDDVEYVNAIIERAMRTTDPNYRGYAEHRIVRKGGEVRHIVVRFTVIMGNRGTVIGTKGANQDITDRVLSENALKQANRQLSLLSSITRHDILNKITSILARLELIEGKIVDPDLSKELDKINGSVLSIKSHIDFTSVYQDLGTSAHAWHDLRKVILSTSVPQHIHLKMDVGDIEVFADPMLVKVFSNLFDNSSRHGVHVDQINVYTIEGKNEMKVVWEDNGVGIPRQDKERIFDRGYGKNTGYGLFLAREILNITDIKIEETGEPGKGARFEIRIPNTMWRKKK